MALEAATYLADLVPSNPNSTDSVGKADDHIRMIKQTLQNTFPGLDGPVDLSGSGSFLRTTGGLITYLEVGDARFRLGIDAAAPGGNLRTLLGYYTDLSTAFYEVCSPTEGWLQRVAGSGVFRMTSTGGVYLFGQADTATASSVVTRGTLNTVLAAAISGINTADYVKKSDASVQTVAGPFRGTNNVAAVGAADPSVYAWNTTGSVASGLLLTNSNVLHLAQMDGTGAYTGARAYLDAANNFVAVGNVIAYSDIRLKVNIRPLEWTGDYDLQPIIYDRKDVDAKGVSGFSAQEVQQVRPTLVHEGEDGTLAVNYNGLVAELWARVQALESRVDDLEWL